MMGHALLLLAALETTTVPRPAPLPPEQKLDAEVEVTLDQVLRLLRERSPRTVADRAQVRIASAETIAAGVLPNPTLEYSGSRLTGGTNTGAADLDQFSADQPLLLFGQRGERRRSAELGVEVAESQAAESLAMRARQARERFSSLLAREERVSLLAESREDLERVAKVVSGRAEAGEKSRYDVLRIDLELRELEADLSSARAEMEEASGGLATLLGLPRWRPRATGELQPAGIDVSDEDSLWDQARRARPLLLTASRNQAAAHEAIDLAKRERLPVPVLSAGGAFTRDARSDSAVAGLLVPLPILDRGQGEIARATARADAADLELEALTAETRADLRRAIAVLLQRRETLAMLERDVMSQLPEMRQMAEDAYREGKADILELLDAMRSRTTARLVHVDDLEAVIQAEIDVLALTGKAGAD